MTAQRFTVEMVRDAVAQVATELQDRFAVRFVVLFGSVATGEGGPMSDVDLAVFIDPQRPRDLEVELAIGVLLTNALQTDDVDVIILNDANPALKFNAVRKGILLLCIDEGEHEDFVIRAASEFYDYKEFLDRQYEFAKSFLRAYPKMSDAELQARVVMLTEALGRLNNLRHYSKKDFLGDFRNSDAALRNLQIVIEALTDIANYLLKRRGTEIPTTRAMTFERLCDLGLLDESLRDKLVQMARFRNLIVHGYAFIDFLGVYEILQTEVDLLGDVADELIHSIGSFAGSSK